MVWWQYLTTGYAVGIIVGFIVVVRILRRLGEDPYRSPFSLIVSSLVWWYSIPFLLEYRKYWKWVSGLEKR